MRDNFQMWEMFTGTDVFSNVIENLIEEARKEREAEYNLAIEDAIDLLKTNGYKIFKQVTTLKEV